MQRSQRFHLIALFHKHIPFYYILNRILIIGSDLQTTPMSHELPCELHSVRVLFFGVHSSFSERILSLVRITLLL